ncbi:PIN domain-containing protein [Gryllotalpicola protaetiae]|uniref:Ribonuclease VapC n=1 Tax=Gryllotalpicola protaetiae TaxID=2419771 RepID=A0A387BNK4_9MICO|nr:PIN domain-containing protein [Gryllotalpicola protaetiae]AYG04288.1 type II toxin-antitoxin system VapC family toxin [Gryllotalpicola protaetiae]
MTSTCDTSVLIPALLPWHVAHVAAREAVSAVTSVPAHVLVESFSVLTRLPVGHRISAASAAEALDRLAWTAVSLPPPAHRELIRRASEAGVSGGAIYDGLIGATAQHHGLRLLTRDARARRTYDALSVGYTLV